MADLLDRIRNVYDDHQDRERLQARQEGHQAALRDARDALLSSALASQQQWRQELQAAGPNDQEAIHAKYTARLQALNDAFAALRQGDPGITTQIDVEQFKQSVTERVGYQRAENALANSRTERGYEYSISY